jgi:hypothetical protein
VFPSARVKSVLRKAFAVMGGDVYDMVESIATSVTLLGVGRVGFSREHVS